VNLPVGKLAPNLLEELLAGLPRPPGEVLLGPALGEDACAIAVPAGTLVAATDPITLTGSDVGAYAVVVNANDVAATGVRPRWFLATVLLPEGTREQEVRDLFEATRQALLRVGATLVGGHTEVTQAVTQPVVVGQMLGLAEDGRFVRSGGVESGHVVVQVGPAPLEGAAVLAAEAPDRLGSVDATLLARARAAAAEPGFSIVEPALLAARCGASALHDPTEGGLASGLYELAEASGLALEVDTQKVSWFEPGVAVCRAVGADPWGTLASGALLAAFPPERLRNALSALERHGSPGREIARGKAGRGVYDTNGRPLPRFEQDELARVLSGKTGT